MDGKRTLPADVFILRRAKDHCWLRVILREGRKRQIRRVAAMLGHPVHRLIRIRIGPLLLGDLKLGHWRRLSSGEVDVLRASVQRSQQRPRKKGQRGKKRG